MEALLLSTSVVTLAEMGDKTQLLSFVLAAKLKHRIPIVMGIFFATLANHFFAGYVGAWVASLISPRTLKWVVAISFFAFGLWALKPDKLDDNRKLRGAGVFITTLIAFFLVEMGDKTQLATIAARGPLRFVDVRRHGNNPRHDDCQCSGCMGWGKVDPPNQYEGDALDSGSALYRVGNSRAICTHFGRLTVIG